MKRKILHKEGNSLPLLSHILNTIVCHIDVLYNYKDEFIPHVVISLNKLWLPITSTIENQELSLLLVELLLYWEDSDGHFIRNISESQIPPLQHNSSFDKVPVEKFTPLCSPESSPRKKAKINEAVHSVTTSVHERSLSPLNMPQCCSDVSFIIRFALHAAGGDDSIKKLGEKAINLFQHVILQWKSENMSTCFDDVISMCVKEASTCEELIGPPNPVVKIAGKNDNSKRCRKDQWWKISWKQQ